MRRLTRSIPPLLGPPRIRRRRGLATLALPLAGALPLTLLMPGAERATAATTASTTRTVQSAKACTPGNWQVRDVETDATEWPVRFSSEHFALRARDAHAAELTADIARASLRGLEAAWTTYRDTVGWPEPYCGSAAKYKVNVLVDPAHEASAAGRDEQDMTIWIEPERLVEDWTTAHELTHNWQFHSQRNRDSAYVGWFWENHAEFMARQVPGNRAGPTCSDLQAGNPWLHWGSTRVNYCSSSFLEHLKNRYGYGLVNDLWLKAPGLHDPAHLTADPILTLRNVTGWSQARLGDEFGRWAMRNVTWDYVDPDGFDWGATLRDQFGTPPAAPLSTLAQRVTALDPLNRARGQYAVPSYAAPQRYGYNVVQLVPAAGRRSVTVSVRGYAQTGRPEVRFGRHVGEPGFDGNPVSTTKPSPDWRWGVVTVTSSGRPRYSALRRGSGGDLTISVRAHDRSHWLVVTATPSRHEKIFFDQAYASVYRYPWAVQLAGATPTGSLPLPRTGGHRHPNGGGWVADGAVVAPTAYVGPRARVLGGRVLDRARIQDDAVVRDGVVKDRAVVGALSNLNGGWTVSGRARVLTTLSTSEGPERTSGVPKPTVTGTATLFGDVELQCPKVTRGAYSGIVTKCNAATAGGDRTGPPAEVTFSTPTGFPGDRKGPNVSARRLTGTGTTVDVEIRNDGGTAAVITGYRLPGAGWKVRSGPTRRFRVAAGSAVTLSLVRGTTGGSLTVRPAVGGNQVVPLLGRS